MEIRNERELKEAYKDLYDWEKISLKIPRVKKSSDYLDYVKKLKKAIREYNKQDDFKRRIYTFVSSNNDCYGFTLLIKFPKSIKTEEKAKEYFMKNEYIPYRPTYYDCTGQHFTSWYKIFKRHDRFMAYHRIDIDC